MKRSRNITIALLFLFALSPLLALRASAASLSADEIMEKAYGQPRPGSSMIEMTMMSVNKRGRKRVRKVRAFSKTYKKEDGTEYSKSLMQFLSPPDERGTGFLSWENPKGDDDQWLFLPALNKTRRIAGGNKSESFMGTDFTYADLQTKEKDDYTYKLLGEEKFGPYDCYRIESIPKEGVDSQYSKSILWVDKKSFMVVRADNYDKKGKLLKVLVVKSLKKIDGFWTPLETSMKNVQKRSMTMLKLHNVKYNSAVKDEYFTQSYMERGV